VAARLHVDSRAIRESQDMEPMVDADLVWRMRDGLAALST
jgi:hypothetical protein